MEICGQMKKLRRILDDKKIAWEDKTEEMSDMVKIARTHFKYKGVQCSVINGYGTYGGWAGANGAQKEEDNEGLLEVMVSDNQPVGWLTAVEAIRFIEEKLGPLNENASD